MHCGSVAGNVVQPSGVIMRTTVRITVNALALSEPPKIRHKPRTTARVCSKSACITLNMELDIKIEKMT